MKKIFLIFTVLTTLIFTSCSSDDNGNGGSYTSITVTSNSYDVDLDETTTFTTKANNGATISEGITYYVDGTEITGSEYTFTTDGTYSVYSKYVNGSTTLTSPTIQIIAYDKTKFNKRVLIEDFTGTWCGYCPRVAYAIDQVTAQTNDATIVAIHRGNDPYNFSGASVLESQIGLTGYPTARLNRGTDWDYPETSNIAQAVNLTSGTNPYLGLALNTSTAGNTVTVQVKSKFGKDFSGLKVVVYALESNLIYNQTNYTSYYGGSSTISNFQHNHVLREVLCADILGEIISGSTLRNTEYSKNFAYTLPGGANAANFTFVAFILDSSNKALNSREAGANETQTFEIE